MTVTAEDIKTKFVEFASTDDAVIDAAIQEAERSTNRAHFGQKADDAVKYLAAHILKSDANAESALSASGGEVTSESVGPLSRSYAPASSAASSSGGGLLTTAYGRRRSQMNREQLGAGVI